jgi:ankyrin repeat protein
MDEKNTETDEFMVCDTLLFKAIFLLVVLVGLLVGCGDATDDSDTPPTPPEQNSAEQETSWSELPSIHDLWSTDLEREQRSPALTLHDAVREGDRTIAERILQMGANVDAVEDSGTPLHFAILEGDTEMVRLLLDCGADATIAYPTQGHFIYTAKPLHLAVRMGDAEMADLLIAYGSPVDVRDSNGGTPLRIAASRGFYNVARLLIACGADVNAACNLGYTPLDMPQAFDMDEVTKLLLAHGAVSGERE